MILRNSSLRKIDPVTGSMMF